jgi:hypothetical protein
VSTVPTRAQLRQRWSCDCERLGVVTPARPGSHTAAAVLCPDRVEVAGDGNPSRAGDVLEVLVPAARCSPADLAALDGIPRAIHTLLTGLERAGRPAHVTYAACTRVRQVRNPDWEPPDPEGQMKDGTISKTIKVPDIWESLALRSGVVIGVWVRWADAATFKPDGFYGIWRGKAYPINYSQALKAVKGL